MKIIDDFTKVNQIVKDEKLDICIVSYGGSLSNTLADILAKNNYKTRTPTYKKILCHSPELLNLDIPIIYIYRNPIKAFISCKRRNYVYKENIRKLNNNRNKKITDDNLLRAMIAQFYKYTKVKMDNILIINSNELFKPSIVDKLKKFLKNNNLKYFPIKFIKPKSKYILDTHKHLKLFMKYKKDIEYINNYS